MCTHWFLVSYSPDFSSLTSIRRKRKISTRFFRRNIETRSLSLCFSNLLHDICCFPYPVCHSYSTSFTHTKKQVEFRSKKTYGRKKKEKLDVADLDLAGNSNNNVRFLKKIYDTHTHTNNPNTYRRKHANSTHRSR